MKIKISIEEVEQLILEKIENFGKKLGTDRVKEAIFWLVWREHNFQTQEEFDAFLIKCARSLQNISDDLEIMNFFGGNDED